MSSPDEWRPNDYNENEQTRLAEDQDLRQLHLLAGD